MGNIFNFNILDFLDESKKEDSAAEGYIITLYAHLIKFCYIRSKQSENIKWINQVVDRAIDINKIKQSTINRISSLSSLYDSGKKEAIDDNKKFGTKENISNIENDSSNIFSLVDTIDKLRDYSNLYKIMIDFAYNNDIRYRIKNEFLKKGIQV